jgi:hypothetical protein
MEYVASGNARPAQRRMAATGRQRPKRLTRKEERELGEEQETLQSSLDRMSRNLAIASGLNLID